MNSSPARNSSYIVRAGDTLYNIARRYNTTVAALYRLNPGVSPNSLQLGQTIRIPSNHYHNNNMTPPPQPPRTDVCYSKARIDLMNQIRYLWQELAAWTRMAIISIATDSPDTNFVTDRLLSLATDFADTLSPLYGNNAASEFESLLRDHLVITTQFVEAIKAGDNSAADDISMELYANADEIAALLASINPNWPEGTVRDALQRFVELTQSEVENRLQGNYEQDIMLYDEIQEHVTAIADVMSEGILAQFPNRF